MDDDIKWTTEGEVHNDIEIENMERKLERGLAFLDTVSVINEDGTIRTRVYRKETHTDQYLNFESNHPLEHKKGVVRTLVHRAKTEVRGDDERRKEIEHLKDALKCNGYPDWILSGMKIEDKSEEEENTTVEETTPGTGQDNKGKKFSVVIPFIKGVSEQLRRVFGGYGIPSHFKPTNTLRQLLVKPKDPVKKEYVTGPISTVWHAQIVMPHMWERLKDHSKQDLVNIGDPAQQLLRSQNTSTSINPEQTISMENTQILSTEEKWFERGYLHQSQHPKPKERWREIQRITSMGQFVRQHHTKKD